MLYNASYEEKQLYVAVIDSGVGIPQEEIPKLFKKFKTVESERYLNPNGIGLGLYICRKVIEQCGGKIYISHSIQKAHDPINHGT